jgi:hypothetical protein
MAASPISPRLLKGGLVLLDPVSSAVVRTIALQYNPDTLTRTLQAQTTTLDQPDRSEALRLKGPAIETIKLEVEIDAADQLETGDAVTQQYGILPLLSALELIVYPTSSQLVATDSLADQGTLEVAPALAPLCLFVWSQKRVVPVRLTEFSITEEAFDPNLNPLRAKVSLGMRVLSVMDLGFTQKGGSLYLQYQRNTEQAAQQYRGGTLDALGLHGPP